MPKAILAMSILRRKAGLTQTQLAAQIGVNQVDISIQENAEPGVRSVRESALGEAAKLFGLEDPDDLLLSYDDFVAKTLNAKEVSSEA